jgi:hypothetical protein
MDCPQNTAAVSQPPSSEGCFAWWGLVLAIAIAPLFGLVWAWMAEVAQAYFAPLILFPVLLGAFVGVSVVGLVRFAQVGHRPTIVLAAVLAALVAGLGQHGVSYLSAYYWKSQSVPSSNVAGLDVSMLMREMRPSFGQFMQAQARQGRPLMGDVVAQGGAAWLSWAIDAMLVVLGAVAVTLPAMRVPYCNRCGTWYRTVRAGKIDVPTARRLAELTGVEEVGDLHSPRYRLSACQNGCSPTRCELSWEGVDGAVDLAQVWLDAASRNQATAILDGLETSSDAPSTSSPSTRPTD